MNEIENNEKEILPSIQLAAKMLNHATTRLEVSDVTLESRKKVQSAYVELLTNEVFRQSIERSRPDVEECHLIFTPHEVPAEESLAWWIFPYEKEETHPQDGFRIFHFPFFGIDAETGGIPIFWGEEGDVEVCGYDKPE